MERPYQPPRAHAGDTPWIDKCAQLGAEATGLGSEQEAVLPRCRDTVDAGHLRRYIFLGHLSDSHLHCSFYRDPDAPAGSEGPFMQQVFGRIASCDVPKETPMGAVSTGPPNAVMTVSF